MQIDIDIALARIYAGHIEATYVGDNDAWEIDDGAAVRTVPAREVPEACGAQEHVERLQVRHCMRLAVADTDDPAAAMGEAGPVGGAP
jgi:hypothetical protein